MDCICIFFIIWIYSISVGNTEFDIYFSGTLCVGHRDLSQTYHPARRLRKLNGQHIIHLNMVFGQTLSRYILNIHLFLNTVRELFDSGGEYSLKMVTNIQSLNFHYS